MIMNVCLSDLLLVLLLGVINRLITVDHFSILSKSSPFLLAHRRAFTTPCHEGNTVYCVGAPRMHHTPISHFIHLPINPVASAMEEKSLSIKISTSTSFPCSSVESYVVLFSVYSSINEENDLLQCCFSSSHIKSGWVSQRQRDQQSKETCPASQE